MAHEYKRHGTTTLFAALNILDGSAISQCQARHRHIEWLKLLKRIDVNVAPDLQIHVVLDNYATHKHPKVWKWLVRRPRIHMHFTETSASWMNMVERFFRNLSESTQRHWWRGFAGRSRRRCVSKVTQALTALPGVGHVDVSLPGKACVDFD